MRKAIFVGGIHGVGKTTICEKLSKSLSIEHYSASFLIKKYKSDCKESIDKRVVDISDNQVALRSAIEKYVVNGARYLIDGHFCLLDEHYSIARIPSNIYLSIKPVGILLLYNDVARIQKRLKNRDKMDYGSSLLASLQDEEISYSRSIASQLQIPYFLANAENDESVIFDYVSDIINTEEK